MDHSYLLMGQYNQTELVNKQYLKQEILLKQVQHLYHLLMSKKLQQHMNHHHML